MEGAFAPSLPLCIGLSALGGLLEVLSTMALAYPEFKKKKGAEYSACHTRSMLALNLALMAIASVAYIVGSWFGPVSLSVPTVMVAKLLFNLMVMGSVLHMEAFSKAQKVGTYCIAAAIITLPDVGPTEQPNQDAIALVSEPPAIIWGGVLMAASLLCCVGMGVLEVRRKKHPDKPAASERVELLVYTTAQVCSAVVGTSTSKMLALVETQYVPYLIATAIVFAAINVVSLIFAAKVVDQGLFVPATILGTLVVNMVTGLVIWQDWRVITKWIAYFSVHMIMLLGISLLSPEDPIASYKNQRQFCTETLGGMARRGTMPDQHLGHEDATSHNMTMTRRRTVAADRACRRSITDPRADRGERAIRVLDQRELQPLGTVDEVASPQPPAVEPPIEPAADAAPATPQPATNWPSASSLNVTVSLDDEPSEHQKGWADILGMVHHKRFSSTPRMQSDCV